MDNADHDVLHAAATWARGAHRVLLVTVVRTWGSSPRPPGSMLAIRDDGLVVGSVSGGCIEDDLIAGVRSQGIRNPRPALVTYGVTAEEAHRFGLPCGGTMELVLEPLGPRSLLDALCEALQRGELVARALDMVTGNVRLEPAGAADELRFDGASLVTVLGPRHRMLVIGAGQLSRYLCEIATGLGYAVTVCDPREEYVEAWPISHVKLVQSMPDDAVVDMRLDARSAVVALTHDPKLDDLALMEALRSPAFYVGALGSRRNNALRRERLKLFDLDDRQIARLRGPAGIYIGSRTPPEIALSILAEVTAEKNGVRIADVRRVSGAKSAIAAAAQTSVCA
ncbi:XdhC family protein [Paraburkholderia sp. J41]|uniref:XdhC family protein n=1 Tax=Paraburkholderia sp. J41 TaxID=2805433 RepID=UPI002AC32D95|nr:XdhC family protein [Paraburkholderia sp. J41]